MPRAALRGESCRRKIIPGDLPALDTLALPYDLYTDHDLAHRVLYVEASRGCPFTCEFCLSSLDVPVRASPLEPFLAALDRLLERGARQFKFVDRTFNLNLKPAGRSSSSSSPAGGTGCSCILKWCRTGCPRRCGKSSRNFLRARCSLKSAFRLSTRQQLRNYQPPAKSRERWRTTCAFCARRPASMSMRI